MLQVMLTSSFIFAPLISPDPKICTGASNIDYFSGIPISSLKSLLAPLLFPAFKAQSTVNLKPHCRPMLSPLHILKCQTNFKKSAEAFSSKSFK